MSPGRRGAPARAGAAVAAALLHALRLAACALLVLAEPVVRAVLATAAFLGFAVTLVFGFLLDAPGFPRWGMLALSAGALPAYWLYLAVLGVFMRLPR